MDVTRRAPGPAPTIEALEFVRFCYQRRRIGWPELYDEMCAVAGRSLFRGWGAEELGAAGIGLSLFEMPGLAALAARVIAEETAAGGGRQASGRRDGSSSASGESRIEAAPAESASVDSLPALRLAPGGI